MQRIFTTILSLFVLALSVQSQPTFFGTPLVDGLNYATYSLSDKGAFRQLRLQANSDASGLNWEFTSDSNGNPDYAINWRPYTGSQTLSGFNAVIDPSSEAASARYNSGFGGASGLLPTITSGNYYTVNVTENSGSDNFMAILETTYAPQSVSSVSGPACAGSCGYEVTIVLSGAPVAGEHAYVRYTTDGFSSSSLVEVSFSGATGTALIPDQGSSTVDYYVYTSPKTLSEINSAVASNGQLAHDMLSLELGQQWRQ